MDKGKLQPKMDTRGDKGFLSLTPVYLIPIRIPTPLASKLHLQRQSLGADRFSRTGPAQPGHKPT
ncbi:MAG TPA: hypothetical protein DCR87_06990 [Acidobacteria bacterium]|nr:hypothetical protein [Acidobacteriota bacterium]